MYIVITPVDETAPEYKRMYILVVSKDIELTGGFKNGVTNSVAPTYGSLILELEMFGIVEGNEIYIEWLDE